MDDDLDLYMMGDDPSVYLSPPDTLVAPLETLDQTLEKSVSSSSIVGNGDEIITNSTNQMLDVVNNKKQRKSNRRQNNNNQQQQQQQQQQRNKNRNRSNNQNDGTSFDDNPINVISAFNRTGKIYNKLRKNDAVKVIDTPSGRAGFVYQSGSGGSNSNNNNNNNNNHHDFSNHGQSNKESNSNWEDSYTQNQFAFNRNANDVKLIPSDDASNKKILPVLTSDGKIALVVRGDTSRYFDENASGNASGSNSISSKKYEPITNLTSIITALNSNNDNNNNNKHNDSININLGDGISDLRAIQEQNRLINRLDEFLASVTNKVKHIEEEIEHKLGIDVDQSKDDDEEGQQEEDDRFHIDQTATTTTTIEPFFEEEEDGRRDLLLINRPLSEVLGLPKKTHYHHPHETLLPTSEIPSTKHHSSSTNVDGRKINTIQRTTIVDSSSILTTTTTDSSQGEEFDLESPEKINIAVIPRFDSELEERLFGKNRDNANRNYNEIPNDASAGAISSIHCAMQVMVAIICACTVFGFLGAFYRIQIVNQIRIIYW